jgi:mycothiol system anti-sigma-R factor
MSAGEILIAIIGGAAVNEYCEVTPWCSRKLACWSAHLRYKDPERAEARAEELAAVIDARPGNLFKLMTALTFVGGAAIVSARQSLTGDTESLHPGEHVLDRVYSYLEGELDDPGRAAIRKHLEECGPCLREYGLEEAVKRLVHKHCGHNVVPGDLRVKMLARTQEVRAKIEII